MEKATIYDFARMCNSHKDCTKCPIAKTASLCHLCIAEQPDKANEIILKWCEEHPVKTRQSKFLEMFPNVKIDENAVVRICPIHVDANSSCVSIDCAKCREEFWLAEVDE